MILPMQEFNSLPFSTLNLYIVSIGDSAFGWEADCIHPGVSIKYPNEAGNRGLNILSCVGNDATIMSGEAKNAKGIVTGKSGRFSEQVIVHFPKKIREKISINDKPDIFPNLFKFNP